MALRILRAGALVASGFVAAVLLLLGYQVVVRQGEDDGGYPDDFSWELEPVRARVRLESRPADFDDLVLADVEEIGRVLNEIEPIVVVLPERRSFLERAWEAVKNDAGTADPEGDAIH